MRRTFLLQGWLNAMPSRSMNVATYVIAVDRSAYVPTHITSSQKLAGYFTG
jgi:hypothetical protein